MRQRAMIAIALITLDPEIIILDEPTTALDVVMQRQILAEIMGLRSRLGFSVIFITHDLSLLVEVADVIAVMYAGGLSSTPPRTRSTEPRDIPTAMDCSTPSPLLHGPRQTLTGVVRLPARHAGSPFWLPLPSPLRFRPRGL